MMDHQNTTTTAANNNNNSSSNSSSSSSNSTTITTTTTTNFDVATTRAPPPIQTTTLSTNQQQQQQRSIQSSSSSTLSSANTNTTPTSPNRSHQKILTNNAPTTNQPSSSSSLITINNNNNNNNNNIRRHYQHHPHHPHQHHHHPKEHFESVDFYSTLSFAPDEDEYDDDESFLMHSMSHYYGLNNSNNNNNLISNTTTTSNATTPTSLMMNFTGLFSSNSSGSNNHINHGLSGENAPNNSDAASSTMIIPQSLSSPSSSSDVHHITAAATSTLESDQHPLAENVIRSHSLTSPRITTTTTSTTSTTIVQAPTSTPRSSSSTPTLSSLPASTASTTALDTTTVRRLHHNNNNQQHHQQQQQHHSTHHHHHHHLPRHLQQYDMHWVNNHLIARFLGTRSLMFLLWLWHHLSSVISLLYYPIYRVTKGIQVRALIFLICLGIVASLTTVSIDTCIFAIEDAHVRFGQITSHFHVNYLLFIAFSLFSAVFAVACVDLISRDSAGSGLPEMKSILSGNYMARYLTLRTMLGKSLGVIAGLGAGLSIGRLGPFVHLSSCIGNSMLKLRYFRKLRKREFEKISMLQAACASGVASCFGSPIGGVLFSIEVTASTYPVTNLWRCIVVTLFGSLFFFVWRRIGIIHTTQINLFSTDFPPYPYELHEMPLFIIVGMVCGCIGALLNHLLIKMIKLRKSVRLFNEHPYYLVCAVTLLTALVSFPLPLMRFSPNYSVNILFSMDDLPEMDYPLGTLTFIAIIKFVLTPISLALPIPAGVFAPVFSIGAFSGRLFGELVKRMLYSNTIPAYYAVVAASALSVGVTRAMSTIVVVSELTGQLSLMLPVILASVFAVGVANFFNENIYDLLLKVRGLPLLSDIVQEGESVKISAKDFMRTDLHYISAQDDTIEQVEDLIERNVHATYPVVENRESMVLLGSAKRKDLQIMLSNARMTVGSSVMMHHHHYPTNTMIPSSSSSMPSFRLRDEDDGDEDDEDRDRDRDRNSDDDDDEADKDDDNMKKEQEAEEQEMIEHNGGDDRERLNREQQQQQQHHVVSIYDAPPTIRLLSEDKNHEVIVRLDPAPLSTPALTPLPKIHFLFLMLRLSHAYVTHGGKLVGVIAKKDLILLAENA